MVQARSGGNADCSLTNLFLIGWIMLITLKQARCERVSHKYGTRNDIPGPPGKYRCTSRKEQELTTAK